LTTDHKDLSGSELHEAKGVDSASADQVFVADGAGSGVFEKITTASIDQTNIFNLNKVYVSQRVADIGTAASTFALMPVAGNITHIRSVVHGTTSGIAGFTFEIGGAAVTEPGFNIASGATNGTVDSSVPTGNNTVSAGGTLEIISDGVEANAVEATFIIEITQTA